MLTRLLVILALLPILAYANKASKFVKEPCYVKSDISRDGVKWELLNRFMWPQDSMIKFRWFTYWIEHIRDHMNTWTWRTYRLLGTGETCPTATSCRQLEINTFLNSKSWKSVFWIDLVVMKYFFTFSIYKAAVLAG